MPQDPARKDKRREAFNRSQARQDSIDLAESESTLGGKVRKYLQTRPTRFSEATNDASIRKQIARARKAGN